MKLIINVDDFGKSKSVNAAVIELMTIKAISSTTVMVNMPYADEAVKLLKIKDVSIGLHINLTEGKCVANPKSIPTLVDQNGCFFSKPLFLKKIKNKEIEDSDLETEIYAQYTKLKGIIGDNISHFDSHQGGLKVPIIYESLLKVTQKEKLKFGIRVYSKYFILRENSTSQLIKPGVLSANKLGLKRIAKEYVFRQITKKRRKHFYTPDGMLYNKNLDAYTVFQDLINTSNKLPYEDIVLEIPCHPANDFSDLENTSLMEERVKEYELLKSKEFLEAIKKIGLVSFNDLKIK